MNLRDNKDYDLSIFMDSSIDSDNIDYFLDKSAENKILLNGENYYTNNIAYITNVDINNDVARVFATVDNYFVYYIDNSLGHALYNYIIELTKTEQGWRIIDLRSNDALEADILGSTLEEYFDLNSNFQILQDINENINNNTLENNKINTLRRVDIEYNWVNARNYAYSYALSYNSKFPSYSNDCMNFASQCMWSGMGGTNTQSAITNRDYPMIDGLAWAYNWHPWTTNWTNCNDFVDFLDTATSVHTTPNTNQYTGYSNASSGDIILVNWDSSSDWDHAYVVYNVNSGSGSLLNRIIVCAHTADRQNVPLSSSGVTDISDFYTINPISQEYH